MTADFTPLTNPTAALKLPTPVTLRTNLTITITTIQCHPATPMQRTIATLIQCLPHRQDIRIILLHKRILSISNHNITGNLQKPIPDPHTDLMRTDTKQYGRSNLLNLTKAGRIRLTIP